jgi:hypothetical protein
MAQGFREQGVLRDRLCCGLGGRCLLNKYSITYLSKLPALCNPGPFN